MQLFHDALAIPLLVMISTGILALHSKPHRVIEEDRNLPRGRRPGLRLTDACRESALKRAECGIHLPHGDGRQSQLCSHGCSSSAYATTGLGYADREEARRDIFDYIVMFYNPGRRHGYNNQQSPVIFEKQYFERLASL